MGFLDVFKTKKTLVEESSKFQLNFSDFQNWFEKEFSGKFEKAETEIKKINKQILESLPEIKKSIQKMEKAKVEEKYREDSVINSLKESYYKRALFAYNKFPVEASEDFDKKVQLILNELNNPNPKEIFVVSTYFKNESKNLIDSLKQTQDLLNKLNEYTSKDGKIIFVKKEINSFLNTFNEKIKENKNLETEVSEKERRIEESTKKIEKIKSDIDHLKNSDKAKREIELKWGIEIFEKDISSLETLIKENLSVLKRPVEKLEHEADLISEEKKSLEKFIKSPFKFFMVEPNEVSNFFDLVKKNTHLLKLKDTDAEKIKKFDFSKLFEIRNEYLEKIKEKEEIERKFEESNLQSEIEDLEQKNERTVKEIEEFLKDVQKNKNKIAENKSEADKIKKELKKLIFEKLKVEIEWKDGTVV